MVSVEYFTFSHVVNNLMLFQLCFSEKIFLNDFEKWLEMVDGVYYCVSGWITFELCSF